MSTMTRTTQDDWVEDAAGVLAILENHRRSVEAFQAHDAEAVALSYAPDAEVHDPSYPAPLHGRDAVRTDYAVLFRAFPDIRVTVDKVLIGGSTIAYAIVLFGTHTGPLATPAGTVPATGRPYELRAGVFAEAGPSGQYRCLRRYYDVAGALRQLGLDG